MRTPDDPALAAAGADPQRWLRLLPFVAVLALLLAGLSPVPLPEAFPQQDKLHHLLGFAAMVFSARVAFPRVRMGWLMAGSLAIALSIELGQGYLPRRTASPIDMLANTFGMLLGWACAWLAGRLRNEGRSGPRPRP